MRTYHEKSWPAEQPGVPDGTNRDDTLVGTRDAGTIRSFACGDEIFGRGARDELRGGRVADHLVGGTVPDLLYGGKGADVLHYRLPSA